MKKKKISSIKVLILILLVLPLLQACGIEQISTGHRGVKTRFGKVTSESLTEGLYFYNPFTENIVELDTRIQKYETQIESYTKDVQLATIISAVNYSPDQSKMHLFYQNIGSDWAIKILQPVLESGVKSIISQFDAVDLIQHRQQATDKITEFLKSQLTPKDIHIHNVALTDINYHEAFEAAVEAKVIAIQKAQEAQNRTVETQEVAKQRIIGAEAEAKSMAIRAEALTKNTTLIQWEMATRWDGKYPLMVMGNSGSLPLINLPSSFLDRK